MVMLAGEPGIGKTRTAQELAAYAEGRGAQVLWGWCYEEVGAPPFWPWVQAIRSYVQQAEPERLRSEMGVGAAGIAEILPEIHAKLPGLETPLELGPERARFRLFDSITAFFKNASQSQPLMLVLDDLHWADKSSLLLLQFLAQESAQFQPGRLLVVGCYRDIELSRQHPLSETLAELSRTAGDRFQSVFLRGLDQDDTARFIKAKMGIEPVTGLAEALFSQSEGNPFFITEIIRLLSESGDLAGGYASMPEVLRIPDRIRTVIGRRLNRLSDQCDHALTTASIIGREFNFVLLSKLVDEIPEDQLLQSVDEAVSNNLIEDVTGQMDRYQFSHALIQQTLAEDVTTSRRVRLHARIGEALEAMYGDGAEAHSAELAYHFGQAAAANGAEKLVRYSLLAGEQALAAYAWEEAAVLFQSGLESKTGESTDAETAALLFGLGRAQVATLPRHRSNEVLDTMRPAFDYYVATGDDARALALAEYPFSMFRGAPGVASLLEEALTLIPSGSLQAARLLERYGNALTSEHGNYGDAVNALAQARAIARREDDVDLEASVLASAASIHWSHLHPQEALENSLGAVELGRRSNNAPLPIDIGRAHFHAMASLIAMGNIRRARPHAVALLAWAESRGGAGLAQALRANEVLAHVEGDWQGALEFSDRGLAAGQGGDTRLLNNRAVLEYQRGEFEQGDDYLERLLETMRLSPVGPHFEYSVAPLVIGVAARLTGKTDRSDVAEAAAETVLSSRSVFPLFAQHARLGLALLAVQHGDTNVAAEQYAAIKSGPSYFTPVGLICPDRVMGLLAQTIGNLDAAVNHFEDALNFCRAAGYRPELAWTCCDYSDTLIQRKLEEDLAKAERLLGESLAISTELGMRPLMERVNQRVNRVQAQPPKSHGRPAGLSEREVEVLRLVASGMSNAVLAAELVLSVRTVERHIANICLKTNSHGRAEATAFAFTHGLMSST